MRQSALTSTSGIPVPNRSLEHDGDYNNTVTTYTLTPAQLAQKRMEWDKQAHAHKRAKEMRV